MRVSMVEKNANVLHVGPFVGMHQHVSHWAGYSEVLYWKLINIYKNLHLFKIRQNIGHFA